MYAHNQFLQSQQYMKTPIYPPNYSPYASSLYYSAQEPWPPAASGSQNHTAAILKKRRENEELIESFIDESPEQCPKAEEAKSDKRKTLKISEAREILSNMCRMQKKLETMSEVLKKSESLSDSEWEKGWKECEQLRDELNELMSTFESNEGILSDLKKRVEQRRRKRGREVRRKMQLKAERALAMERRARRHAEADAWIREKREVIEREKQVELLRKDADIVLADVRGKRSDAKKFLGLLQELQNLRKVKVNIARARGENLPLAADQAFNNIIGQLLDQWTALDREYSIEEQGMKVMLKTDNEQKIEKQKRSTFDDWEIALFGKKLQSYDPARGNSHTLLATRCAWDKYANCTGEGSRIPIGWVMPVIPSSAAWQKCLRKQ